jgi:hypothetical protein
MLNENQESKSIEDKISFWKPLKDSMNGFFEEIGKLGKFNIRFFKEVVINLSLW